MQKTKNKLPTDGTWGWQKKKKDKKKRLLKKEKKRKQRKATLAVDYSHSLRTVNVLYHSQARNTTSKQHKGLMLEGGKYATSVVNQMGFAL